MHSHKEILAECSNVKNMGCFVILFNDGHVLQLRPETVAVLRRMRNGLDDYDGQMVSGDKCGLNFLTFVLQLRDNPGENLIQETDPTGIWTGPVSWEAMTLPLDQIDDRFETC